MNIKIEQNMSIGDLPNMTNFHLGNVDLFDKNEKPWSKHACNTKESYSFFIGQDVPLELCLIGLATEENYLNDICQNRGHLFLNEVYDRLQTRRTKDGQMMGWFVNKNRKEDKIVEFTVYIDHDDVMVDFNVEGNIYDIFDELS